jgi:hypothetical protein
MPTPLTTFFEPVRLLLGDLDATVRRYPDATVAAGVRTAVQVRLPGRYTITPDGTGLVETPTPDGFALICLHTGLAFVAAEPESEGLRTRAVSVTRGSRRGLLMELKSQAWRLARGGCFRSWLDLHSWMLGIRGLPLPESMARTELETPWTTVYVTRTGAVTATGADNAAASPTVNPVLQDAAGNCYQLSVAAPYGVPQLDLTPLAGCPEAVGTVELADAAGIRYRGIAVQGDLAPQLDISLA